ncbi:SDR family oxidoreductase, partial [Candidatus Bathyarchaeota archaeon]|nr:SDR family oxidoreductase [Candidatus Bathyarchaeota archaeon]
MERLLITGASGLLGSEIVQLARKDYEVIPSHNTKLFHSDSLRLDITDQKQVSSLFRQLKPDTVIHTAAETSVDRCEIQKELASKINVEGTGNVAVTCSKINAKIVYISTDYIFDGEKRFYTEEDTPNPINHYGITKLKGERQVKKFCKNYVILRTSVLYGWHPWKQ